MTSFAMWAAVVAALAIGLWLGERGRRIDAQRIARIYQRPAGGRATVTNDADVAGAPSEQVISEEQVEQMIRDTMRETGCNREMAELDVAQMLKAGAIMGLEH